MQFTNLPEPVISCSHVLAYSPLLFRLDARQSDASFVLTEHAEPRRPHIHMCGDLAITKRLFFTALEILGKMDQRSIRHDEPTERPLFTLDVRPPSSFLQDYDAIVSGFSDGSVTVVTHGRMVVNQFIGDLRSIHTRLTELGKIFYPG
jgi:hypothetical protein